MPAAQQISARFLPDSPHLSFLCPWNASRVSPPRKSCESLPVRLLKRPAAVCLPLFGEDPELPTGRRHHVLGLGRRERAQRLGRVCGQGELSGVSVGSARHWAGPYPPRRSPPRGSLSRGCVPFQCRASSSGTAREWAARISAAIRWPTQPARARRGWQRAGQELLRSRVFWCTAVIGFPSN